MNYPPLYVKTTVLDRLKEMLKKCLRSIFPFMAPGLHIYRLQKLGEPEKVPGYMTKI